MYSDWPTLTRWGVQILEGRSQEVLQSVDQGIKDLPPNEMAGWHFLVKGKGLIGLGRFEEAEEMLVKSVNKYPSHWSTREASTLLGLLALKRGAGQEAEDYWISDYRYSYATREFWAIHCLKGKPGDWIRDVSGFVFSPEEVMQVMRGTDRDLFQDYLNFRASFDPAWKPWASNPNPFEKK